MSCRVLCHDTGTNKPKRAVSKHVSVHQLYSHKRVKYFAWSILILDMMMKVLCMHNSDSKMLRAGQVKYCFAKITTSNAVTLYTFVDTDHSCGWCLGFGAICAYVRMKCCLLEKIWDTMCRLQAFVAETEANLCLTHKAIDCADAVIC